MGSNGLTSARHDVFANYLAVKYPESYNADIPQDLAYSGSCNLTDKIEGLGIDAGKLVLSPTRTYAPVVKKLLEELRPQIHGMVHCSGGAGPTLSFDCISCPCRVARVPPMSKNVAQRGHETANL